MEDDSTPALSPGQILQTGLGFWASKTLLSAVEMEVFSLSWPGIPLIWRP